MQDRDILRWVVGLLRSYERTNDPISPRQCGWVANRIELDRAAEKKPEETRVTDGIHGVAPGENYSVYDEYVRYCRDAKRSRLADWLAVYRDCVKPVAPPESIGDAARRGHMHWCANVNGPRACDCGYVEPMIGEARGRFVWTGAEWRKLDSNYVPVK